MPDRPLKYSFVLMTCNQESTVRDALIGAFSQDCEPIEILISDDCSKDNTFEIIQETIASYSGPHKVIAHRNERNLGLAGNIGVVHDLSSGDIIIAAAGDDVSLPNRSSRIMQAFDTGNPLLVCSLAEVMDASGKRLSGNFHEATLYNTKDLKKVAKSKSLYIGATGAWHRDLYYKYGQLDPQAYEDLVFGFRAALEGRIAVIEEELVKYRLGYGITSSTLSPTDILSFIAIRTKGFIVAKATMRQRLDDAKTFGLTRSSSVWRILKRSLIKATLGHAYYEDHSAVFRRESIKHPFLALHTIYSERRRKIKFVRNLARQKQLLDSNRQRTGPTN